MGDVGLPAFVGELGFEAGVRRLRAFVGLGGDEAAGLEDAPDRRGRRCRQTALFEVPVDRRRPGIDTQIDEFFAEGNDGVFVLVSDPCW